MKKRDIDYDRADRLSEEYYAARRSIFYHANILKGNTPMKPLMNPRQGEDYFFHYFKILDIREECDRLQEEYAVVVGERQG